MLGHTRGIKMATVTSIKTLTSKVNGVNRTAGALSEKMILQATNFSLIKF